MNKEEQENFWNDLGAEPDDTAITFLSSLEEQENKQETTEQEDPTALDLPDVSEPVTQPAPVDPYASRFTDLENKFNQLMSKLEQGQPAPQPAQYAPRQEPQPQFNYAPQRNLNDADLALYHNQLMQNLAPVINQSAQQMHDIRVNYEKQALASAKNSVLAQHPDVFKYVDESRVNQLFEEGLKRGEFGVDWSTRIEAAYKISVHDDLKKAANELDSARKAKAAKQDKALRAVTPGGAVYQPPANQPAVGNGRGFKSASVGFLAEMGL